ncbi:hypothetical protein AB7C87_21825 [Natrarchaeobius sp. A-rgal3]|uniref:hypothetical protein n=1 Tax=Natrarchaeobius versutus TaxID=1679078 RepID=UPI0035105263
MHSNAESKPRTDERKSTLERAWILSLVIGPFVVLHGLSRGSGATVVGGGLTCGLGLIGLWSAASPRFER